MKSYKYFFMLTVGYIGSKDTDGSQVDYKNNSVKLQRTKSYLIAEIM